ncbi:uncharacterized protein LOC144203524 [Stigmatopora nigra]
MSAVNRPATSRLPAEEDPLYRASGGLPSTGQQDPGPQGPSQDQTPHPQLHPRPVFYVPPPPPPPFFHYQWPMSFPYNSFPGFPGMGYGMMMPPFPPPPYMDPQPYIMPHPHLQHVDYRRFLQGPMYQNPNQPRRVRSPCTLPVKETTNSQVQTEPTRGSCSDKESGRGTASCSPSSSSCSQKDSAEVDALLGSRARHDDKMTEKKLPNEMLQTQNRLPSVSNPEKNPPKKNVHCNRWSVSSQESIVPLCSSSQQEDENMKERSAPVPDICMRWRGAVPKESDKELRDENRLDFNGDRQGEVFVQPSASDTKNIPVLVDNRILCSKIDTIEELLLESRKELASLGQGCIFNNQSQNKGEHVSNYFQDLETDRATDPSKQSFAYKLHSPGKRKVNESVWSVESLAPFIPNKEWLMLNGLVETPRIEKHNEKDKLSKINDFETNSNGSQPSSDPWPATSPPVEKTNPVQTPVKNPELSGSSENQPLPCSQHNLSESSEDGGENGSSEPVAEQSPNQDFHSVARRAGSPCKADQDGIPTIAQLAPNVEAAEFGNVELLDGESRPRGQQCVPLTGLCPEDIGQCVFVSFHCNGFHKSTCTNKELKSNRGSMGKHSGLRNGVSGSGRSLKNKKCGPWIKKRHGKPNNHWENGHNGEPKLKGGDEETQR